MRQRISRLRAGAGMVVVALLLGGCAHELSQEAAGPAADADRNAPRTGPSGSRDSSPGSAAGATGAGALMERKCSMSAVEVVDKMVDALGGAERLRAFQTAEESLDFSFPDGAVIPAKVYWKAPNLFRMEVFLAGVTMVEVFDGKEGFSFRQTADGERALIPASAETIEGIKRKAEGYGFGKYLDYAAWGSTVTCLRVESQGGRDEIVLEWRGASGSQTIEYVDTESWLTNRYVTTATEGGTTAQIEFVVTRYENVDGVVRPFRLEARELGDGDPDLSMTLTTRELRINHDVPDRLFSREGMPRGSTESLRTKVGA